MVSSLFYLLSLPAAPLSTPVVEPGDGSLSYSIHVQLSKNAAIIKPVKKGHDAEFLNMIYFKIKHFLINFQAIENSGKLHLKW